MPWKPPNPIEIYNLLPRTNCGKCGEANCMAFAVKVSNLETAIEECPPLLEEKYSNNYRKAKSLVAPPIKEIMLKSPKRIVKIGGKYVLHRHELRYMNPTAIAIDVDDSMDKDTLMKRLNLAENFIYEYVGRQLKLDLIAIRSVSNDQKQYMKTVQTVVENCSLPLILCSHNPRVIEAGLSVLSTEYKPLIYAANKDNWREMVELAKTFNSALAISSSGDLNSLVSIAKTLTEDVGLEDVALDPGCPANINGLPYVIKAFTQLRYKAINEGYKYSTYPLIGTPISIWASKIDDPIQKMWWETILSTILMTRYADLIIMHSIEGWALLPLTIWRFQLYTDPRKPVAVEPGIKTIGSPDDTSPVFVTSNYALTYSIVLNDIQKSGINAWLIVIDTEGLAVDVSVAAKKFTGEKISELIKQKNLEEKIKHRILVIPGKAARISGELEEVSKWKVLVGPTDSSEISSFIKKIWTPEKIREIMES
ncbi:MAG: acetyl-CoA decarbonylase/synthase complex subunit gamma [Candidatus Methanomethylicia archaeon]|nr:acetyl-CoA decarbonylase/synthase complex subunit gamma [Candidatus Methanomethylicia archaeon]MCX8168918.1 acetyl-CoA decarbonylase/synthase complex subunit gamma [Candidatus Methanomethylicia archaeon]MDW7988650.1 acetyl-CoA decarbonylase/synthase complex subunit gamma [Nitrososphaerota archaeon]